MGVESLLSPKSIAIVGASEKVGPGFNAFKALEFVGYEGDVYLVNPRSPELFGRKTYASIDQIPGTIDAVFVAVQAEAVLEIATQAARKGAGALAILSSGFGETADGKIAQQELVRICEANDIAVCGPNCLGLLNFVGRSALFGTSLPDRVGRGGVAAVVQSGSVGIALLNSGRGLGFSYLITTGNEAVTSASDYINALVHDANVTTILVFAEQIKKPAAFIDAIRRARAADKPVIVFKSGRSEFGKAAVMAHTGAVAGNDEAADAALRAAGAIQVFSLDDLIETSLLASKIAMRPSRSLLGGLSLSGGEIAFVLDSSEESGARFAPLDSAGAIKQLLPPFAHLANPLDLTWAGLYDPNIARGCAEAIASQANVGMLVLIQDAPHPALQAVADAINVPYLRGTRTGMSAIARYIKWATEPIPLAPEVSIAEVNAARLRLDRMPSHRLPAEHEAREALKSYGVVGPREMFAPSLEEAIAAAEEIGFPVVLKGMVENMVHKSDAGLVKIGLSSASEVGIEAKKMVASVAKLSEARFMGFLVQHKVLSLGEIFVGARVDVDFGPIIVVGAGGVQVELYKDVAIRLAPIDEKSAAEAIASTRVSKLLAGFRGAPVGDVDAVARTVSALSRFISDFADRISEIEINPLAVLANGQGCVALDCVIVPADRRG
jgi:acetate---CoA ligase (ADP-forming)